MNYTDNPSNTEEPAETLRSSGGFGGNTPVPGIKACHRWITDTCRSNRTDLGAMHEAVTPLQLELIKLFEVWPRGKNTRFHLVLTVEEDSTHGHAGSKRGSLQGLWAGPLNPPSDGPNGSLSDMHGETFGQKLARVRHAVDSEAELRRLLGALGELADMARNRTSTRVMLRDRIQAILADSAQSATPGGLWRHMAEIDRLRAAIEDIGTMAHCISLAGPANTPDLAAAWSKFDRISIMATAALSPNIPQSATSEGQSPAQPNNPSPGVAL